jgi:hypothetical protein
LLRWTVLTAVMSVTNPEKMLTATRMSAVM